MLSLHAYNAISQRINISTSHITLMERKHIHLIYKTLLNGSRAWWLSSHLSLIKWTNKKTKRPDLARQRLPPSSIFSKERLQVLGMCLAVQSLRNCLGDLPVHCWRVYAKQRCSNLTFGFLGAVGAEAAAAPWRKYTNIVRAKSAIK